MSQYIAKLQQYVSWIVTMCFVYSSQSFRPRHTLCDYSGSLGHRTRFVSTQKTFHH